MLYCGYVQLYFTSLNLHFIMNLKLGRVPVGLDFNAIINKLNMLSREAVGKSVLNLNAFIVKLFSFY